MKKVFAKNLCLKFCFALLLLSLSLSCSNSKSLNKNILSGHWLVTVSTQGTGEVQTVLNFKLTGKINATEYSFEAYSPENADRKVFGFWKAQMARLFTHNFKKGSILHLEKGRLINNDSITGVLNTPFGNFNLSGKVKDNDFHTNLEDQNGQVAGSLNGQKGMPKLPLRDYPSLWKNIVQLTKEKLYDHSLLKQKGWQKFNKEMTKISSSTDDDATFILAFFYYGRRDLPFSHYFLLHPIPNVDSGLANSAKSNHFVQIKQESLHTVYMRISSFAGSASEMDSSFVKIAKGGFDTLIVDLRNNEGGSISAGMAFVRHLIPDTVTGGAFLTRKYFSAHTLPNILEFKNFPSFSKANYKLLLKGISNYDGIRLLAFPQSPIFKGKVFVLTNNVTASTCEPIVYMLKKNKIATIVGGKTAGAMLNGEEFSLSDGFVLTIPTATYYTSDGFKIDQNGVTPNITVKADSALEYVLQKQQSHE